MKTNNQGRYSAKARRVSTPRATVTPRSSAAPGAAAPRQGPAPRLAATRSAYTRGGRPSGHRAARERLPKAYTLHADLGRRGLRSAQGRPRGVRRRGAARRPRVRVLRLLAQRPRHGQRRGSPGAHPFVRRGRPQGQQLLRRQARPPALGWRQRAQGGRRRALLRHAGRR